MIERRLLRQLEKAAGRFRHLRVIMSWSVVWILAAIAAVVALAMNQSVGLYSPFAGPIIGGAAILGALIVGIAAMRTGARLSLGSTTC